MVRWSVPAFVVLYTILLPNTVIGTNLVPFGADVDGERHHFVDQIAAVIERANKQEDRLRTMETLLATHTVDLAEKDRRIVYLENELADMKSREAISHTSQMTISKGRNIEDDNQDELGTNQSGIDQRIADQKGRKYIDHNGTKQENPAQSQRILNTDLHDSDSETDHTGEKTASFDVRLQKKEGNPRARGPGILTEIGQPLAWKQQQKRVDNTPPERYAFSLYLSRNTNAVALEIIKYDTVILDLGNGYNHGNGIYEVPASGVYVFTWSTTSDTNHGGILYTELLVNGVVQMPIDVDSDTTNYESATGLIVMSVNAGDHVYVRTMSSSLIISFGHGRSTFSGWRLF